jgi:hypothetical protein
MLGARGDSGVIVSQMLRGLSDVLVASSPAAPPAAVRAGLRRAVDLAYGAVARPVEGTVLTVARAAADAADSEDSDDLGAVVSAAWRGADDALRRTPEQLDVLGRAGVVDAGGRGLVVMLDALAAVVTGRAPEVMSEQVPPRPRPGDPTPTDGPAYEVMFLLDAAAPAVDALRTALGALGDSLVVVGGDLLWNVHVHVDDAGAVLEAALRAGRPHRIAITYLATSGPRAVQPQPRETASPPGRGVVAVVSGGGLAALFESVGAHPVVGGPGHRPSTADLLDAIRTCGTEEVVLLPNDGDSLAVAEAAAERARVDGTRVSVVPTRAIVQGLAAIAVHDPTRRFEDDVVGMTAAASATRYGGVTVAVREAFTSAGRCQAGDALGLMDDEVVDVGDNLGDTAVAVIDRMLGGVGELVTLVSGRDVPEGLLDRVTEHLHRSRPDVETVAYEGGQDLYPLLIGVE